MRRAILVLIAGLAVAGCGSTQGGGGRIQSTNLVLDFTPNAIHAGIYAALAARADVRNGVHLHIVVPSASTDSIRLLETGRVGFALLDIHDLAIARERGQDIVGVMAIVQRPLAAVLAAPGVRSPRDLAGRTVGVTGVPSDSAVLDSEVAGAGGDPRRVHTITIGFDAVADLLAGRVAGATAFWNDEGVTIRRRSPGFHVFRVDSYGAPAYPELILCATASSLRAHPGLARGVVRTLVSGYRETLRDPSRALRALAAQVPGLDVPLQAQELRALLPAFDEPGGKIGALDPVRLERWARWERRFGIVTRTPDLATTFNRSYLPPGG